MILLARAITRNFYTLTNNHLRPSFNTRNQAIVQGDRVNIQSRNSGNDGRNTRRSYVQEEIIEGANVPNDAGKIQRILQTTSSRTAANVQCYNYSEKGVILTDEQNDFLFADASRMEEIEELSANICLMAIIQPTNIDSDAGSSYDYAFLSEVQTPSTSYVNLLFAKKNFEQKYPMQPNIINNTAGDDEIDSNIIFDDPNDDDNNSSVEDDNNAHQAYELEQLARNVYKEAEKQQIVAKQVQQQNIVLTKQLELRKDKGLKRAGQDVVEEPVKRQRTREASGVGGHTEAYQTFDDMLKKFDRDDLDKLYNLVKERFNTIEPTEDKARELWVELKRLFEPDDNDTLWKLQRYMHDPLKWWLYDTCGVHYVSIERAHDIYMLVEKDYPLTKALATLMLCNKLRVDQYSDMTDELL
ncbi:hypothetical protein Tco_1436404 [Tanacetum coccineum]